MNKVILMGRLTRDPEVRYSQGGAEQIAIARFSLAVERRFKHDGEQNADFISCVAFKKTGELVEKYLRQGSRITICGRIQTGSYTNKDGQKVYTVEVVVEELEFAESKGERNENNAAKKNEGRSTSTAQQDGFMNIPDGIDDELPFN